MRAYLCLLLLLCLPALLRGELQAEQLLLIVNANVPESATVAQHYIEARGVPAKNVLTVSLTDQERMTYADYEPQLAQPVRDWLAANDPQQQIRCLVTFYGVPLKIDDRQADEAEATEARQVEEDLQMVLDKLVRTAQYLEDMAREFEPTYTAAPSEEVEGVILRLQRASLELSRMARTQPAEAGESIRQELLKIQQTLQLPFKPSTDQLSITQAQVVEMARQVGDPDARQRTRDIARGHVPMLEYARLLEAHRRQLGTKETGAAVDSELALVLWPSYSRARWQTNPFWIGAAELKTPRGLMTARIDGRDAAQAIRLIDDALATEKQGLRGRVVIDSRGLPEQDKKGYGLYDASLRRFAEIVRGTTLELVEDTQPTLIEPGTATDAAIYAGWYSVGQYKRPATFVTGAVAFHIASYEMTTLRNPANNGWVRGLLADGVTASLGPVAEPFLLAFPPADEFFSLLLCGKVTLAEAYWATIPLASWQMGLVGDPLYQPYKTNPVLAMEGLPAKVRGVVGR